MNRRGGGSYSGGTATAAAASSMVSEISFYLQMYGFGFAYLLSIVVLLFILFYLFSSIRNENTTANSRAYQH